MRQGARLFYPHIKQSLDVGCPYRGCVTLVQANPSAQGQVLGSDSAVSHQQYTFLASGKTDTCILVGGSGQYPAACTPPTELIESLHSSKPSNNWSQHLDADRAGSHLYCFRCNSFTLDYFLFLIAHGQRLFPAAPNFSITAPSSESG